MAFRLDIAADTLGKTLDALAPAWDVLPQPTRVAIQQSIMTGGPKIAAANSFTASSAIVELLEGFWAQKGTLPDAVAGILQAGQGATPALARLTPTVPDATRSTLLDRLTKIADFRYFKDPQATAEALVDIVKANEDRLRPEEHTGWQKLHDAFARGGDPEPFLRAAGTLLGGYPAVKSLLDDAKTFVRPVTVVHRAASAAGKGSLGSSTSARSTGGMSMSFAPGGLMNTLLGPSRLPATGGNTTVRTRPPTAVATDSGDDLTRFANVIFPATVLVTQQAVPLIVHVAQVHSQQSVISADESRMALKVGDLTIVVQAEGFAVVGSMGGQPASGDSGGRVVKVEADRDCEPAIFLLAPQSTGEKRINVYIDQFGRNILTRAFQVKVVADLAAVQALPGVAVDPQPVESPVRGADAPPPDLELRVMLSGDRRKLSFMLHGGPDYNFRSMGETDPLPDEPRVFLQPIFDRLSGLARRSAAARSADETAAARKELADLGANLFDQLFTTALKEEYGKTIRKKYAGKALLITSDEPWIPWEVVRPFAVDDTGDILYDDPPLCEMFRLSRWLSGRGAPDQVAMKQGVWVAPADNLQAAQAESRYFAELHRRQWQVSLSGPLTRAVDVQARFQSKDTQLFHFACHGNFDATNPDNSMIKLEGGFLSPSQIGVQARAGLLATKPVVFLNA
ncbi:MAG: CHAT domain-containing protein, partial [Anaerolineae bacterium]|nr:CHAT domain-containing protein [Anaerolineae bacterium]